MNELQKKLFKLMNYQYSKCCYGVMDCDNEAIDAHSISKNIVLRLISADSHVYGIQRKLNGLKSIEFNFEKIGINRASVFKGLCDKHDKLFNEIDSEEFNKDSLVHINLYNYRALLKTYYECIYSVNILQYSNSTHRKYSKEDQGTIFSEEVISTDKMLLAWIIFSKKIDLEKHIDGKYECNIKTELRFINDVKPTVASTTFFSLNTFQEYTDEVPFVFINVIPISNKTIVTISYYKQHDSIINNHLYGLLNSEKDYFKYELSKTLLKYTTNIYLSPLLYESWNDDKIKFINNFLVKTTLDYNYDLNDKRLMLF